MRILVAISEGNGEAAADVRPVIDAMQKIANRITMGVVLAGLIVGASLPMRVATPFQIFGFPGLAIVCFPGAAAGGFRPVTSSFVHAYRTRKQRPR